MASTLLRTPIVLSAVPTVQTTGSLSRRCCFKQGIRTRPAFFGTVFPATACIQAAWRKSWQGAGSTDSSRPYRSGARIIRRSSDDGPGPSDDEGFVDDLSLSLRAALDRFQTEVQKPDSDIDLTLAAALLALHAYPQLDIEATVLSPLRELSQGFKRRAWGLEQLAGSSAGTLAGARREASLAAALCSFLRSEGFQGCGRSSEEYYVAENSMLHKVLERRRGIPISLAVIYREVGRSTGLQLWGANFPGHFFLAYGQGPDAGLLDAFSGRTAAGPEAAELVSSVFGQPVSLDPNWSSGPRLPNVMFLARMARNLQNVYEQAGNIGQAARIVQYSQVLEQAASTERL
eukprot:TRINITY_DN42739_c0_g1_i1.p1 TRINITY_DN42739_c0_g1~~TRINITY_DN42739_c0_g1_i1.p1  ORF type:complete len:346 (+),score=53.88 TRINITY_DN42739_c0_g1_i1:51-1088(+)